MTGPAPTRQSQVASGYYLYGIVRARGWRGGLARRRGRDGEAFQRIRFRDLEALTRAVPFDVPALDRAALEAHQRLVEGAMRQCTILPAPPGVVFRSRRPLIRFLEDQYPALDEGLAFLEGHWELRLHIEARVAGDPDRSLHEVAAGVYTALRRLARAALPFPCDAPRLLSAAFLVERDAWVEFIERAEALAGAHEELALDVTGPWPPYDFVRIVP